MVHHGLVQSLRQLCVKNEGIDLRNAKALVCSNVRLSYSALWGIKKPGPVSRVWAVYLFASPMLIIMRSLFFIIIIIIVNVFAVSTARFYSRHGLGVGLKRGPKDKGNKSNQTFKQKQARRVSTRRRRRDRKQRVRRGRSR